MKTCPICHAQCFDDMEVCYGCMHRFTDDDSASGGHPAAASEQGSERRRRPARELDIPVIGQAEGELADAQPVRRSPAADNQVTARIEAVKEPRHARGRTDGRSGETINRILDPFGAAGYQLVISLQPVPQRETARS